MEVSFPWMCPSHGSVRPTEVFDDLDIQDKENNDQLPLRYLDLNS